MIAPAEMAVDYARWRRVCGAQAARDFVRYRVTDCRQNASLLRSFNSDSETAKRLDAQAQQWEALL